MTDTDTPTRRQRLKAWFARQWEINAWPKVSLGVLVALMIGIGYGRKTAPKPDLELALSALELPTPVAPDLSGVAKTADLASVAKTAEVNALASTLGEINASLKLLAEKPAVDVSDLAQAEKVKELVALIDGLPARIPNPDVISWLKSEEGQLALKALATTVDTSALEKAVADLSTKVGETPTTLMTEIKALREEVAKIPAPAQADAGVTAMTEARDNLATQLRASEAKLAAAEAKATAMEQYADGLFAWFNGIIGPQLGHKLEQGQDGAWALVSMQ